MKNFIGPPRLPLGQQAENGFHGDAQVAQNRFAAKNIGAYCDAAEEQVAWASRPCIS